MMNLGPLILVQHTIYLKVPLHAHMFNHTRENDKVTIGNGKKLSILYVGTKLFASSLKTFQLKKVFHVPHLATYLISVSKLCIHNNSILELHHLSFLSRTRLQRKLFFKANLKMASTSC